jgi:hypothetical protein
VDNRVKGVQGGFTVNTSVNGGQCIKGLSEVGQIGHDKGTYGFRWNHIVHVEYLMSMSDQICHAGPSGLPAPSGNDYLFCTIIHNINRDRILHGWWQS